MKGRRGWLAGLGVVVLVVVAAAVFASPAPDGLERVAADVGFADQASDAPTGLLAGYEIPALAGSDISTILAGILGIVVLFLAMVLLGRVLARRNRAAG
jgi:hypothetical protein